MVKKVSCFLVALCIFAVGLVGFTPSASAATVQSVSYNVQEPATWVSLRIIMNNQLLDYLLIFEWDGSRTTLNFSLDNGSTPWYLDVATDFQYNNAGGNKLIAYGLRGANGTFYATQQGQVNGLYLGISDNFDPFTIVAWSYGNTNPNIAMEFSSSWANVMGWQSYEVRFTGDDTYKEVIDTLNKNNTTLLDKLEGWFQQVIDAINGNGSQDAGQDSADQVEGVIPDHSAGATGAVSKLVAAMGFEGTNAVLPISEVKVPGIPGLYDDFVLMEAQRFSFRPYIEMMPASLMTLVRSLFTIALIVYCFKELYDTISYVMTLRRGSD